MAILALILTFAILISAIIVSNNTMSGHRLFRQTPLPTGVPKTFLSLIAVMFAIACVWQFAIDTLDDMRHPAFWISAFGADPILGDVFSTAEQYDMDLGMPTAEFRESDLLMIRNVSRCVATALWCAVAGLAAYAVYMLGLLRENKPTMITCLALLAAALIVGGRASMAGMVHFHPRHILGRLRHPPFLFGQDEQRFRLPCLAVVVHRGHGSQPLLRVHRPYADTQHAGWNSRIAALFALMPNRIHRRHSAALQGPRGI